MVAARQLAPGLAFALREVAALDRQRLAHVEIHPPTALEAALAKRLPTRPRLILRKDARLMRRRYPMAWVVGFGLWGVAVVTRVWYAEQAQTVMLWLLAIGAGYGFVLATRTVRAPIDGGELRVLAGFPVTQVTAAKVAWVALWSVCFVLGPVWLLVGIVGWWIPASALAVLYGAAWLWIANTRRRAHP